MKRRQFFSGAAGAVLAGRSMRAGVSCGCALAPPQNPLGADAFRGVGSRLKITNMKVFVVSLTPDSDRPFVFVKLETDGGVIGWGEGTLEGKAKSRYHEVSHWFAITAKLRKKPRKSDRISARDNQGQSRSHHDRLHRGLGPHTVRQARQ